MKIEVLHNINDPCDILALKDPDKMVYFSYPFYSNIGSRGEVFYTVDIIMYIELFLNGDMTIQHYFLVHVDNVIELYIQLPIEDKPVFDVVLYDFWQKAIEALADHNVDHDSDTLLRVETHLDWKITFEKTLDRYAIYITTEDCHYRISDVKYESVSSIFESLPDDVISQNKFSHIKDQVEYEDFKIIDLNLQHRLLNIYDGAKKQNA